MKWPLLLDYSDIKRNVSIVDQHHVLSLLDDKNFKPFFLKTFDKGTHNNTVNFIIDKDTKKSIIKTSERPDISNENESLIYSSYLSKNKDSILTLYTKESFYFNEWVGENEKIPARYNSIDGDFIVSDIMNIKKDEKNRTIEYRAFIVGGEVNSLSRYLDFEHHEINKDIFDFCKKFVDKYKNKLPLFYILDVAETDKGIEIIELNPFELSGRYLENCPILLAKKLQDMSSNYAGFIINKKNIFIPDENINGDVNNFFKNFL